MNMKNFFGESKKADIKNDIKSTKNTFDPDKRLDGKAHTFKDTDNKEFNPDVRIKPTETKEVGLKELINDYVKDLKNKSVFPDLISDKPFGIKDIKYMPSEIVVKQRVDFNSIKVKLIKEWEKTNNKEWPTYKKDVYDKNENLIRKKGDKYDVHHILPLKIGGENDVKNITPIHALDHYDHSGIHKTDSALDKIEKNVKDK